MKPLGTKVLNTLRLILRKIDIEDAIEKNAIETNLF